MLSRRRWCWAYDNPHMPHSLSIAESAQMACVFEATARKPGNVTRFQDFDDLSYLDFLLSAAAVAPIFGRATELGVGRTVLEATKAARRFVRTNANLGIALLLAPLAAVPSDRDLRAGLDAVLAQLTIDDSLSVFEAIRLANPGGLGEVPEQDVRGKPTQPLRQIMALAADRDLIARQYANGFREVFEIGVPQLAGPFLEAAIIRCHLHLLSTCNDTHVARRCGPAEAVELSRRAAEALLAGPEALAEFDSWLRADGNRRNPGASADLVAASLFVALREGKIAIPVQFYPPGSDRRLAGNAG